MTPSPSLNESINKEYDIYKDDEMKAFAAYMESNEKPILELLLQQYINDNQNDDIAIKLKQLRALCSAVLH